MGFDLFIIDRFLSRGVVHICTFARCSIVNRRLRIVDFFIHRYTGVVNSLVGLDSYIIFGWQGSLILRLITYSCPDIAKYDTRIVNVKDIYLFKKDLTVCRD
jgi:hypothetical protein